MPMEWHPAWAPTLAPRALVGGGRALPMRVTSAPSPLLCPATLLLAAWAQQLARAWAVELLQAAPSPLLRLPAPRVRGAHPHMPCVAALCILVDVLIKCRRRLGQHLMNPPQCTCACCVWLRT